MIPLFRRTVTLNAIMDTLSSLGEKIDNNFKKLRDEMEIFKHDLKPPKSKR